MAQGTLGFAQLFSRDPPDLLLVLGDRFEMHAATVAAVPFALPIAHIHGGESTEGVMDECFRHAVTKMSHLHFVATQDYARRVIQMGEQPWRVTVSGAPGLDAIAQVPRLSEKELQKRFGIPWAKNCLLVTFHPSTLNYQDTKKQIDALLAALKQTKQPIVFTSPNADTSNRTILEAIIGFTQKNKNARLISNLGSLGYFSLMALAKAMVGNSSSGIIEAASFFLPVVNIGDRQRGRVRSKNIIDVEVQSQDIAKAIANATSREFRKACQGIPNPYGDGRAADRIVNVLEKTPIDKKLLIKRFYDNPRLRPKDAT
jgi:UDP-N-acetylglucosamine 2-epimerase (non-hydrolysing)/GDP/UDP-N,N'-diacetylbacillosamine 2-epimerase (hydrolysing)